jgi:hypothetical protein
MMDVAYLNLVWPIKYQYAIGNVRNELMMIRSE